MYVKISEELRELAELFEKNGEELFIVGGYVRDSALGLKSEVSDDIDLCSACLPDKVEKILKHSRFICDAKNKKVGAVVITGEKRYEFTTFRRENYSLNGEHNPTGVEFIKDINQDALRRDFTINAIYCNINTGEIVDPVGGLADIKQGIIRTPTNSTKSFREDSERILRMIRFACLFNFSIDEKTLESALECGAGLVNLSKVRIKKEFEKMIVCDTFYPEHKPSQFAHARCMILLGTFNLWKYILPAIDTLQQSKLKDEKGESLYQHTIKTLSVCGPSVRLACLLHDVGKIYTKTNRKNFEFSNDWAEVLIEQNLGASNLNFSKKTIVETKQIIKALDWDKFGLEPTKKVKQFVRTNFDIFEKLCFLKDAIALENTNFSSTSKIAARWKKVYNQMIQDKIPITIAELAVNGSDIIEKIPDVKIETISELLEELLNFCLIHPRCNEKEILVQKLQKIVKKEPKKYLE